MNQIQQTEPVEFVAKIMPDEFVAKIIKAVAELEERVSKLESKVP